MRERERERKVTMRVYLTDLINGNVRNGEWGLNWLFSCRVRLCARVSFCRGGAALAFTAGNKL